MVNPTARAKVANIPGWPVHSAAVMRLPSTTVLIRSVGSRKAPGGLGLRSAAGMTGATSSSEDVGGGEYLGAVTGRHHRSAGPVDVANPVDHSVAELQVLRPIAHQNKDFGSGCIRIGHEVLRSVRSAVR
jgi:hypothetical protein